jgi:hypothetical protein
MRGLMTNVKEHDMSHISRTPVGKYRANWRDPSGRQRAKTFVTKKAARQFLAEIKSSMTRGAYVILMQVGRCLLNMVPSG